MSASSALVLWAVVQGASGPTAGWGLDWQAGVDCVQRDELSQRVEARLGRAVFGPSPRLRIDGALVPAEGGAGWSAHLSLIDAASGAVQGRRDVESREPGCRAIDDSLVLVLAVMIDPAATLREPAPAATVSPPPPPVMPPLLPAPPRAPDPDALVLDQGHLYQGVEQIDHAAFYRLLGRADLLTQMWRRLALKVVSFVLAGGGLAAGTSLLVLSATGAGCVRYSGSATLPGSCLESDNRALYGGIASLVGGAALLLVGTVVSREPTTLEQDQQLIDEYNYQARSARRPPIAVRASGWVSPSGAGLGLRGEF